MAGTGEVRRRADCQLETRLDETSPVGDHGMIWWSGGASVIGDSTVDRRWSTWRCTGHPITAHTPPEFPARRYGFLRFRMFRRNRLCLISHPPYPLLSLPALQNPTCPCAQPLCPSAFCLHSRHLPFIRAAASGLKSRCLPTYPRLHALYPTNTLCHLSHRPSICSYKTPLSPITTFHLSPLIKIHSSTHHHGRS